MGAGSKAVQAKQYTLDTDQLSKSLEVYRDELDTIKDSGVIIYDDSSCDDAAIVATRAKELAKKIKDNFKTTEDLLKQAQSAMKSAVNVFIEPLEKLEGQIRTEVKDYLKLNPAAECINARMQKSKWKMEVEDEDELFRSMITTNQKKGLDGKMYTEIILDPKIRALFVYNEAKGNALASAITNTLPIPGTKIFQDEMLVIKEMA